MKKYIFLLIVFVFGCVSPPDYSGGKRSGASSTSNRAAVLATPKTELVREKMTKEEVRAIFGQPDQVKSNSLGSSWEWKPAKCFVEPLSPFRVILTYSCKVEFNKDGTVEGWNTNVSPYVLQ